MLPSPQRLEMFIRQFFSCLNGHYVGNNGLSRAGKDARNRIEFVMVCGYFMLLFVIYGLKTRTPSDSVG